MTALMKIGGSELRERVLKAVASALDRDPSEIDLYASLIDDLGAESIDFLDIRFRVESEFGIKIPDDDLWQGELLSSGSGLLTERGVTREGLRTLQERLPEFRWERFPDGISQADLPRLLTPATIISYLEKRLR